MTVKNLIKLSKGIVRYNILDTANEYYQYKVDYANYKCAGCVEKFRYWERHTSKVTLPETVLNAKVINFSINSVQDALEIYI